ncbi:hypothetical protein RhiirA4_431393, partial [Rhizophagus irregularis]
NSRIFSEQYNCNWWQQTESQLKIGSRVLSIILYSDATLCDSLGNIPSWQRNKKNAKVLLGYMPILQSKNQATRNSDNFRKLIRKVTKRCWSILLRPIMKLDELELNIKNVQITFAPRISVFLADMLEANAITCTYKSANCKMPCPSCIVHIEDLNNMNISKENITLRTPNSMASVIQNKKAKEYSIHDQKNVFWNFPNLNVYEAVLPDRMHHLDLGLFKYMLEYTQDLLIEQCGNYAIEEFNNRLAAIPKFTGLKIFNNGITSV